MSSIFDSVLSDDFEVAEERAPYLNKRCASEFKGKVTKMVLAPSSDPDKAGQSFSLVEFEIEEGKGFVGTEAKETLEEVGPGDKVTVYFEISAPGKYRRRFERRDWVSALSGITKTPVKDITRALNDPAERPKFLETIFDADTYVNTPIALSTTEPNDGGWRTFKISATA